MSAVVGVSGVGPCDLFCSAFVLLRVEFLQARTVIKLNNPMDEELPMLLSVVKRLASHTNLQKGEGSGHVATQPVVTKEGIALGSDMIPLYGYRNSRTSIPPVQEQLDQDISSLY